MWSERVFDRIRHRNALTEKAWENAEQGLATLRVPAHHAITMEFLGADCRYLSGNEDERGETVFTRRLVVL